MATYVLLILFLLCSVLLILLILIQKGRGAGLAGAFGGGGGQSAFGTKTADVLTKATAVLTAIFFLLALVSGWYLNREPSTASGGKSSVEHPAEPGGHPPGEGQPAEGGQGEGGAAPDSGGAEAPAPAAPEAPVEVPSEGSDQ
ncbi:MAG: preprotein translocase subunit SecG [Anaerolineaceae bacterium]|nr:preprotein translocase subunit SecG [Anaerolineaceae bacterium]